MHCTFFRPVRFLAGRFCHATFDARRLLHLTSARRISDLLKNAELKVAEGKIELDQEYSSNAGFTSYYVYVGRKKIGFTEDMSHIFKAGERYRVFYCKASVHELIMSYERLSS